MKKKPVKNVSKSTASAKKKAAPALKPAVKKAVVKRTDKKRDDSNDLPEWTSSFRKKMTPEISKMILKVRAEFEKDARSVKLFDHFDAAISDAIDDAQSEHDLAVGYVTDSIESEYDELDSYDVREAFESDAKLNELKLARDVVWEARLI